MKINSGEYRLFGWFFETQVFDQHNYVSNIPKNWKMEDLLVFDEV